MTFCLRLRVRYQECDAQGIVFNARWLDFVDIAAGEYTRAVFGAIDAVDLRLRKQTIEWLAPARYDDVLDIRVHVLRIGTTSFTLAHEIARRDARLATAETVYVVVDNAANAKRPITPAARAALERGADVTIDQSGTRL
jgi:acyl-CoA thioester hydrolase